MKRLLLKTILIGLITVFYSSSLIMAGSYTTNNHFYKPEYGEKGHAGYDNYNAALDALDTKFQAIYTAFIGTGSFSRPKYSIYAPAEPIGASGTYGWIIDKLSTTAGSHGLVFAIDGTPKWGSGMDSENEEYVPVAEVIGGVVRDNLRVRSGAKFVMGYSVGHPNENIRFEINTGETENVQTLLALVKSPGATIATPISYFDGSGYPFYIDYLGNIVCNTVWTEGPTIRIANGVTIVNPTDPGTKGMITWDANYIYVCTATNTWKRVALSSW